MSALDFPIFLLCFVAVIGVWCLTLALIYFSEFKLAPLIKRLWRWLKCQKIIVGR